MSDLIEGLIERTGDESKIPTVNEIISYYKGVSWAEKFILDHTQRIVLVGSRRAAKTTNIAAKIGYTDLYYRPEITDSYIYYASTSFEHAHDLMWRKLENFKKMFDINDWNMNAKTRGIIRTPRNVIRILGFNDLDSIGKALGQPFKLFVIDEAQEIRNDILRIVVKDAGSWGTLDASGTLVLAGNPCRHKYHFFSQEILKERCHIYKASIFDNPFLSKEKKEKFLAEKRKIEGEVKGKESPEFRRMAYGHIVFDSSNMVFNITPENYYIQSPMNMTKIIGVDLGWRAHSAIVVLGWRKGKPEERGNIYLLEEYQETKLSFEKLAEKVDEIAERHGVHTIVIDTGGLGEMALPEMISRYSKRSWIPTKKRDKLVWIKTLQTEIRSGRFKVHKDCLFERECNLIEWEDKSDKINDRIHHSDLMDAIIYGVRYCHNNLSEVTNEEYNFRNITRNWDDYKKKLADPPPRNDEWTHDVPDDCWL